MVSRRRLPLLVAFPAFYVGASAMRAGEARPAAWVFVAVAMGVALAGGRVREGTELGDARRRVLSATGLSIAIATAALSMRAPWATVLRDAGLWMATFAAARALGAIDGEVGLAPRASEAIAPPGFGPRHVVWAAIGLLSLACLNAAVSDALSDPTHAAMVSCGAAVVALAAVGGAALLIGAQRRLELEVKPRAMACAVAAGFGLVVAAALALGDVFSPDAAIALGATLACVAIVRLARAAEPMTLARRGRRALTLGVFGGPIALLAATMASGRSGSGAAAVLGLVTLALLVATVAAKLEEPFLPVKGVMLEALADARDAAREREARIAMARALVRIREACAIGLGPTAAPSPELWLLHPTRVLTVNAAGYLQERSGLELPAGLVDVALGEPHGTVRTSVLRALEVRRAELRPLLAWLEHRDALFATVIAESEDPDGLLVVPTGSRTEEATLEEIRAAKLVANAFVAVAQAESAKVRHLERERVLKERNDALDEEMARLRHAMDLDASRHVLAATRLARPATVGIYSAASRMAYDALERRIAQDAPTVVVARAGVDPVPWVARAHLSGPRKNGALVVVDATASREHDLERWTDERTSPLALADHGLLFLVDGAALPRDVQTMIARAVAERRPPWERPTPLDVTIALSATKPPAELVEEGRLATELAARFEGGEAVLLPGLRDRPEDLRSIVADRLAREGLRVAGRPIGIEAAAFARLVEHAWDGEDAELAALVTRLVARVVASGSDVVRAPDVEALDPAAEPPPARVSRSWDRS